MPVRTTIQKSKEICVTGCALFALFFGSGSLILPPNLGLLAGESWGLAAIGFCISAVLLPILGIFAHARLQGSIYDFGKPLGPVFGYLYAILVYLIALSLPVSRTASVIHEMALAPFGKIPSWITSSLYFAVVLFFILKRSMILGIIGKFLTPIILLVVFSMIGLAFLSATNVMMSTALSHPFATGILEGYQTYNTIGAVIIGGVLILSLDQERKRNFKAKKILMHNAGIVAGLGLLFIYAGITWMGGHYSQEFAIHSSQTAVLTELSTLVLGNFGIVALSILMVCACFTTAVGILTGTADFIKGICGGSQLAYTITAVLGCALAVAINQFDMPYILAITIPALALIYPVTVVLILLHVIPKKWASPKVFKTVVFIVILFSLPDMLDVLGITHIASPLRSFIPLGTYTMGWVFPAIIVFIAKNRFGR